MPIFVYMSDYYEYYSFYTYKNVTITKVVKLRELKIYYGRYGKNDKKPNSYFYSNNYEILYNNLVFHNNKIYIEGNPNFFKIAGKDTNIVILNALDYSFFIKENKINNKKNILLFNSHPVFFNENEELDNLKSNSKVKREYELGKNNILDKIF